MGRPRSWPSRCPATLRACARATRSRCRGWSPSPGPWPTARAWRSGRLGSSRPFRRRRPRRADQRGGGARATVREGAGVRDRRPGPLHPPSRVRQHPAFASGVEPMMPTDPTRRSALSVALLAHTGTDYDLDAWMAGDGQANGSVRYDSDRAWFTIQGRPAALRKLAEALVRCAELTEQTYPTQAPVEAAAS